MAMTEYCGLILNRNIGGVVSNVREGHHHMRSSAAVPPVTQACSIRSFFFANGPGIHSLAVVPLLLQMTVNNLLFLLGPGTNPNGPMRKCSRRQKKLEAL